MRFAPLRMVRMHPGGDREIEWDRRRGIRLEESQRRAVGAGMRIALNTVGSDPDLRDFSVHDNGIHRVTLLPPEGRETGLVRVDLGIRSATVPDWLRIDFTVVEDDDDGKNE